MATDGTQKYSTFTPKKKSQVRVIARFEAFDILLKTLSGSQDLGEHELFVHDRLKKMHPNYERFSWVNMRKMITNISPLQKFEGTDNQKKVNRYRYVLLNSLAEKLSGFSYNNRRCLQLLLKARFPEAFQLSWNELLDREN